MKKILLFASAVAVLFSSCSTDNTQDVVGVEAKNGTISAAAAYQQDETRTHLAGQSVVWSNGDAIGVFAEGMPQVQYGLTSGEGTAVGNFTGNANYLTNGEEVFAYYPFVKGTDVVDSTAKIVVMEISANQTFKGDATFDAAQAPAVAYVAEVEDKTDLELSFKGVASYVMFPVTGAGTLKSLTLNINNQWLAGEAAVDFNNYPTAEEIEAAEDGEDVYADLALVVNGSKEVTVDFGALELDPHNAVNVMFVVPAGIKVSDDISLTATFANNETETLTKDALNKEVVLKRNAVQPINYTGGATWNFGFKNAYVIDDVAKFGLEPAEAAALDFITYAYFTQADQTSTVADYATSTSYNGPSLNDWALLFDLYKDAAYTVVGKIVAEEIDFTNFDAQSVFHKLGVYTTEKPEYDMVTVYKNALTWYIENGNAIESMAWGENGIAVIGVNEEPSVIKGLTVLGNGIVAPHTYTSVTAGQLTGSPVTNPVVAGSQKGASLENLEFVNTIVIADASMDAGFVAPTSKAASIKNVVIGAGNTINGLEADAAYSVGGIYGVYYGGATGVVVETLPEVIVREDATTYGLRPSDAVVMPSSKNGQVFGSVYAGTSNIVINLNDYKVVSLDAMPAVHTVSAANNNVIDFVAADAIGATIDNVLVANGATVDNAASVVLNKVSYWNGFAAQTAGGADYYTAEELAYVLAAGNSANITLTHDIDMQCVDTEEESQVVTLTHYQSSAFNVNTTYTGTGANKVYNVFEIKNLIGKTVDTMGATLFGYTANVSNVTLSNVTIETGYPANFIAGLAHTGTAQNVVINDLTINVEDGHFNKAGSIGGVFAEATDKSVKNVTVNSCAINYEGDNASDINVGIVAGKLNIAPDATVTLEGIKLSTVKDNYSIKGFAKTSWWATSADIENFVDTKAWAGRYPFGIVNVANAQFATYGNTKAYLAVDNNFQSWSSRLAAGVVFNSDLTDAAADTVEFDAAKEYKYAFILNGATIGNNNCTVFGFSKKN